MLLSQCIDLIIILLFLSFVSVSSIESMEQMTIELKEPKTDDTKDVYNGFIYLNHSSIIQINLNNSIEELSFIIFQVHSHLYKVTMYRNKFQSDTYEYGTNIGLYSKIAENDVFYIKNMNNDIDLKLYLAIQGYKKQDPVPGGCNMESHVPVSTDLVIQEFSDYLYVDIAPAQNPQEPNCLNPSQVSVKVYLMYMPERNFDADVYFESIKSMMNLPSIEKNGVIVPAMSKMMQMRRIVGLYPGTGMVFVAVAKAGADGYALYVPAQTYGCSPFSNDGCELIKDLLSCVLCALLVFVGLFLCYLRHRFFKIELFTFGFTSGFVLTYIFISYLVVTDRTAVVAASALSGLFFGSMWLMFWWVYGIPIIALLLTSLNLGFLMASLFYYVIPDDLYFREDLNYWLIFALIVLVCAIIMISATFEANTLACAILGGYAVIYPIDYYIGSNLKYILINTMRRATVPNFKSATLVLNYQYKDLVLTLLWASLTVTSFAYQYYTNYGRPPFPPPPRGIRARPPSFARLSARDPGTCDERTPLLS